MFRIIMLALAPIALATPVFAWQQAGPRYGKIEADNVRVHCGMNAYDAEIGRLMKDDPVEIVAAHGDWVELRVPGGFHAWVRKSSGSRVFVEVREDGRAHSLVEDLLLRPKAGTDWPALGSLDAGEAVEVVGERGDWLQVKAPADETLFVMSRYVREGTDQAALARAFAEKDVAAVEPALAAPAAVRRDVPPERVVSVQDAAFEDELAQLDARLEALSKTEGVPQTGELVRLRAAYQDLAARAPAESDVRARAQSRVAFVADRELISGKLGEADERLRRLESAIESSEAGYAEELADIRRKRQGELAATSEAPETRFLAYGIGEIYKDYGGSIGEAPTFMLVKAGERRFRLVSDRYDLAEYHGKTIGIASWDELPADGDRFPKIRVKRLEILP